MKTILVILMITSAASLMAMADHKRKQILRRKRWLAELQPGDMVWLIPARQERKVYRNTFDGFVWLCPAERDSMRYERVETYKIEPIDDTEYVYVIDRELWFGKDK